MNDDQINNPSHYAEGRLVQPIDAIEDWKLGFNLGNVVKYVSRAGRKGNCPVSDLKKAAWYLEREIKMHKKYEALVQHGSDLHEEVIRYYGETLDRYS